MSATQVQIEFGNEELLNTFVKWFLKEGFEKLITSDLNVGSTKLNQEQITCMAADEEMDWGHYFELE